MSQKKNRTPVAAGKPPAQSDTPVPAASPVQPASLVQNYMWLQKIVDNDLLGAVFQPLINFRSGEIFGFEGLVRGPAASPLHMPVALFRAAEACGMCIELEYAAQKAVLTQFARLGRPGKLFVNISPEGFCHQSVRFGELLALVRNLGLAPDRIVIELTENRPTADFRHMRDALLAYRRAGFQIALDDLGEGFASLRLWSELKPDYVKIDMHFVQGINLDPLKLQFLKAIQQIAQSEGSQVIAEGIETQVELRIVRDLGISLGQGYFIARPSANPPLATPAEVLEAVGSSGIALYPRLMRHGRQITAEKLLIPAVPIPPDMQNDEVFALFEADKDLRIIPVAKEDGQPVGLIVRYRFTDAYARPYRKELFGRRGCEIFVDASTLIVEKTVGIHELSQSLADAQRTNLLDGFVITDQGRYAGIGTGQDLIREITEMQIDAARHSNPLTLLPGSVPINEHLDRLLFHGAAFSACYCDLDNFKPFNDLYGYQRGDEMIMLTAQVLVSCCDPDQDFIGHIGGDDFFVVFQSPDWIQRCESALTAFEHSSRRIFSAGDLERGGMTATDRRGNPVSYPLTALSIGAVRVEPGMYTSHKEVSSAATEAKCQAKRESGHTLFVERRRS